ncbi:hypothetical protein [Halobacteriovorax sp. HLS]|uniref:hypothetical protein n=1 Tax=Halobacteriovorax sp. HLS TaxID=2234000 RepID=UPI000FDAFE78|nr:hypothetical protein [Halobacteriovorax sp. HLS]
MKKTLGLIVIISAGFYFYYHNLKSPKLETSDQTIEHKESAQSPSQPTHDHSSHSHLSPGPDNTKKEPKKLIKVVPIPEDKSGKSLIQMSETLSLLANDNIDIEELKDNLTSKGLNLTIANDSNEHTGKMTIIRTQNTLPGTRYFHAQIFQDEEGNSFVQHMSFEYRPGIDAFEQAIATAKKYFNLNRDPDTSKDDFVSWSTKTGHVIWIKKMSKEDLENDPFNAYTDSDVGTIKVAKELEIH